jgi:hypothetical protein
LKQLDIGDNMKRLVSGFRDEHTVFFSEADSFTLINQQIPSQELLRKLRIASLLYDHVVLAAAYFWQSKTMYSLMPYVETLINSGDILPAIRSPRITRDIADYFDKRLDETSLLLSSPIRSIPSLASEIAVPKRRPVALELNKIGTFLYIDVGSVEKEFRQLWIDDSIDQKNPCSIFNLVLVTVPSDEQQSIIKLLRSLSNTQFFSRSSVAMQILDLSIPKQAKYILIQRTSDLYLMANAIASGSDLLVTSRTFDYSLGDYSNSLLGPLAKSNVDLFMRILKMCGISKRTIDSLSDEELLSIKYSYEFAAFREIYYSLIESAVVEERNFVEEVWQKFPHIWGIEKLKKKLILFLKYIESISSVLFAASLGSVIQEVNPVSQAILVGSGATASMSHLLKGMEWFYNTPTIDFVDYMMRQEYKKRLSRRVVR